jgi:hypothetical protein
MAQTANTPQNVLLISENKLKNFTDIDANVTSAVLLPFISVVQQTKVEYILGGRYYRQLLDQVSTDTLSTINSNFLIYFVQPLLIWASYAECLPSVFMRIKNNGIVTGSEQTVTTKDMEFLQRRADDRSQFFEQRMIEELIFNSGDYPLVYSWSSSDGLRPHLGKNYFSGIYLNNGSRYGDLDSIRYSGLPIYADPVFFCCGI